MQQSRQLKIQQITQSLKRDFQKRYRVKSSLSHPVQSTTFKPPKSNSPAQTLFQSQQRYHENGSHSHENGSHSHKNGSYSHENGSHSHEYSSQPQINHKQMSQTLQKLNFQHHRKSECVCANCTCGRHLCKLDMIKPDMRKKTQYMMQFKAKRQQQTLVLKTKEYDSLRGNHLDVQSIYLKDFNQKLMQKMDRPKPIDHLQFDGPAPTVTTYSNMYPGHRGRNQYIKPTDRHRRGQFSLFAKSMYSSQFGSKKESKEESMRMKDQLRGGEEWMGATTYQNNFKQPNPEQYPLRVKNVDKIQANSSYAYQFVTNYQRQYFGKPSPICPSKIQLESSSASNFQRSKQNFNQNTDFRSLSPEFHALATSRSPF